MQPTKSNRQTNFKNIMVSILMMGIAVLLIYFSFKNVSFSQILLQIKKANFFWVFCSFLASVIALFYRAQRWRDLVVATGNEASFKESLRGLSAGYLANLAFPRLGEISRCSYLQKFAGVPINVGIGTVIIERVVDVISLLICFVAITVIEMKRIGGFMMSNFIDPLSLKFKALEYSTIMFIALSFLVILVVLFILFKKNFNKNRKMPAFVTGFFLGMKSIITIRSKRKFVFQTTMIWLFYFLSVYACFFALPSTAGLGPVQAFFLLVVGGIAMSAPVQGGIGIYHLLVSQGLIIYGLKAGDGLAFATLIHSLQLILILLFGIFALLRTLNTSKVRSPVL